MIALLVAAGVAAAAALFGTKVLIGLARRTSRAPADLTRGRCGPGHEAKAGTPTMGGMAIVGRRVRRLRGRPPAQRRDLHPHRPLRHARDDRRGCRRLPRRLDQGPQRAQPRAQQAHEDDRPARRVDRLRRSCTCSSRAARPRLGFTRFDHPGLELGNLGWSVLAVLLILATTNAVNLTDGLDGLAAGSAIFVVRRVRGDRLLGLPPSARLCPAARARPRRGRRGDARRLRGLPLVERRAGADHHGRHGLAGHRRRRSRAWRSRRTPRCCCRSSAGSTSSRRCR